MIAPLNLPPLSDMTPSAARIEFAKARFFLKDREPGDALVTLGKLGQRYTRTHCYGLLDPDEEVAGKLWEAADAAGLVEHHGADTVQTVLTTAIETAQLRPDEDPHTTKLISATPFQWADAALMRRREFLYGTHYARKFPSATIAPSGVGKSSLVLTEAVAIASYRPLLGIQPKNRAKVWYWNGEDPAEEVDRRIAAICLHYRLTKEDLDGWLFRDSGRDQEIILAKQTRDGGVIAEPVYEALVATIKANGIDLVVIDPFISSHRVIENDNGAIDMVVKRWSKIADETNCAIELVHHSRKTGGQEVAVEDGRGAVAMLAATRSARVLNVMTKDEGAKYGVTSHRSYFRVENGKTSMSKPPEKADWHCIHSVSLGNGEPSNIFDTGDSVGVVATWTLPDPLAGLTGADFDKAAVVIRAGRWRESSQAKDWVGKAVAQALGLDLDEKRDRAKAAGIVRMWIGAGSLVVVEGLDANREPRKFVEVKDDL